jgi:hypothetical protein
MIVHLISSAMSKTNPKMTGRPSSYCEADGATAANGHFEPTWWWVTDGCPEEHANEYFDFCEDCKTSSTLSQDILGGMYEKHMGHRYHRTPKKLYEGTNR